MKGQMMTEDVISGDKRKTKEMTFGQRLKKSEEMSYANG